MTHAEATTVSRPRGEGALIWLGFPCAGAVLGWLVPRVAAWLVSFDGLPLPGPIELIAALPPLPTAIVGAVVGVIGGVVLAFMSDSEYVSVIVTDTELRLVREERTRGASREQVGAVFVDGKDLVVLGRDTHELIRQPGDLPAPNRLRAALTAHGYPWTDEDPHHAEYRRWIDGHPDLSAPVHALLKARANALEHEKPDDAAELRSELAAFAVIVRDRDGDQYFRVVEA